MTTTDGSRRWGRRTAVGGGLALAGLAATIIPAWGHTSFPSSTAFGFAPNTTGGIGGDAAPPYAANTAVTVFMRAPVEQDQPFNGADDTNVDVKAVVPAGWTSPGCGAVKANTRSVDTNDTNQPGADVAGWACEIITENGHEAIHWFGPQVVPPATKADSAVWFVFTVTTPTPAAQTTYNGAAGSGTEGFIADQRYASGVTEHWIPSADFPGTPPSESETKVSANLARTVAAFDPNSTSTTTSTSTSTSTTSTTIATTTTTAIPARAAAAVAAQPAFTG